MEVPSTLFLPCLKTTPSFVTNSNYSLLSKNETSFVFSNTFTEYDQFNNKSILNYLVKQNFTQLSTSLPSITLSPNANFNKTYSALNNKTLNSIRRKRIVASNEFLSTTLPQKLIILSTNDKVDKINEIFDKDEMIKESTVFTIRAHENDCMKLKV